MTLKSDQNNNTLENNTITPDQVQFWDKEHIIHPWSDLSDSPPDMTQIQKAKGIYLEDGHGNKMIDGPGGMWCVNIGYGRREMADGEARAMGVCAQRRYCHDGCYCGRWRASVEAIACIRRD